MGKKKLRNIVVDGKRYLWAFRHGYALNKAVAYLDYYCDDQFLAYMEDHRNHPLKIRFITWESPISGGPLRDVGPLELLDPNSPHINLHTPKWAALVIHAAAAQGWRGESAAMTIENGMEFLKNLYQRMEINQDTE